MIATAGHSSENKNVALWDSLLPQKKALITGMYCLMFAFRILKTETGNYFLII